ncbi:hypothetical protein G9A89_021696, partial [Geosiphon pyriformis]
MAWLQENWAEIMELIPHEAIESSPFDEQKIASKSNATMETASEDGTVDTYGTIL